MRLVKKRSQTKKIEEVGHSESSEERAVSPKKTGRSKKNLFLLVVGLVLIGFGGKQLYDRYKATHQPQVNQPKILQKVVTSSTDKPDETKIGPNAQYTVAKDIPKKITRGTINSWGYIQQVGIDQHIAIAVPNNIHFAGWYNQTVRPGDNGLSIIVGHVSGKYSDGVFKRLGNLKAKDQFTVEYGDGSKRTFEVVDVSSYPTAQATEKLYGRLDKVDKQLNLITCGGKFDSKSNQFQQRIIVRAKVV